LKYFAKNCKFLRIEKNKTQAEISAQLGFSRSTWTNYESEVSTPSITDLVAIAKYFDITESQLLHTDLSKKGNLILKGGNTDLKAKSNLKGNVIGNPIAENTEKSKNLTLVAEEKAHYPKLITVDTRGEENVVMVNSKARAGYLNGYGDPEFIQKLPAYRLPGLNNGTFRMFEVEGLSMYPTLNSGDIVIGSYVDQWRLIRDDRLYVFVTKNEGVVVKRVLNRVEKDGKFILKSDNYKERDLYPNLVISPGDVIEIWYCSGFLSRNMRPPSEMYNRVIDLEGRLSLVEHFIKRNS